MDLAHVLVEAAAFLFISIIRLVVTRGQVGLLIIMSDTKNRAYLRSKLILTRTYQRLWGKVIIYLALFVIIISIDIIVSWFLQY